MKAVHAVLLFAALTGATTCLFIRKYIFVDSALKWTDAQKYCRNYYVDLSTINSLEELDNFNTDAIGYLTEYSWIGLSRSLYNTVYTQWSDGTKLEFTAWTPSEPKTQKNFLCVYVYKSAFAAEKCSVSLPFFCYKWVPQITVVQEMMNWEKAFGYCRMHYNDLISLTTVKDLLALETMNITTQTPSVWTGLRFMDGLWFWVNQEPLGNLISVSSCPVKPFHCGALKARGYILENRNCNEEMTFICY